MVKVGKIVGLMFTVAVVSSCSNYSESSGNIATEVATENLIVADYAIEGMVCAMGCAATIQKEVANINGVVNSKVDYETGKAHFEFDETFVSQQEIVSAIESIANGQYKVKQWEDTTIFEDEIETGNDDVDVSQETESSLTSVSLPSIKIPNLLTLLLDQI